VGSRIYSAQLKKIRINYEITEEKKR
jgi:hypothetical protein